MSTGTQIFFLEWLLTPWAAAPLCACDALSRSDFGCASRVADGSCCRIGEGRLNDPQVSASLSADVELGDIWGDVYHLSRGLVRPRIGESHDDGSLDVELALVRYPHPHVNWDQVCYGEA